MNDLEWWHAMSCYDINLSRLSRQAQKMSGQLEANKDAMPRLSRHVPTQNNKGEMEKEHETDPGKVAGRKLKARQKRIARQIVLINACKRLAKAHAIVQRIVDNDFAHTLPRPCAKQEQPPDNQSRTPLMISARATAERMVTNA